MDTGKKLYNRFGEEILNERQICVEVGNERIPILYFEIDSTNKAYIYSNDENCKKISPEQLKREIENLYFILTINSITPVSKSIIINNYKSLCANEELITDINPISYDGNISFDDPISFDICIELPVRKACKILNSLGIKTIMSGCNKKNVSSKNIPASNNDVSNIRMYKHFMHQELKSKKVYDTKYGGGNDYFFGNGFAWIAIDWDLLSLENKMLLIDLKNGKEKISLCENGINALNDNCIVNEISLSQDVLFDFFETIGVYKDFSIPIEYKYKELKTLLEKNDESDNAFDIMSSIMINMNSFSGNGMHYRTAILKYPLNENTTVEEVENYFSNLLKKFKFNYHKTNESTVNKTL